MPRLETGQRRGARIPFEVPQLLEGVAEALRSHPRRSQRVLEVYSLLALNLVR
jgi:hypothetical protein